MTFLLVLGFIILILIGIAIVAWPMIVWLGIGDDRNWTLRTKILHTIGAVLALAALVSFIITIVPSSNGSEHCGPGTRYVSESHYNPATKSTIREWECIAE